MDPNLAKDECPATYEVHVVTNEGDFKIKVTRAWSPQGADRFYNLVKIGYLDGCRFFRVMSGFVAQFGIHGDPKIYGAWKDHTIVDDSPGDARRQNARGTITFAKTGAPNSRTVQLFINLGENQRLDGTGFTPFGYVTSGMRVVNSLYTGYGQQPDQGKIGARGNEYLAESFPDLDYIQRARLVKQ
ncbi:MAG: peptidylprolyl isomerase [Planctomycetes bacterium]|nr:peptidylprolyl isomerase [Planctomycetota bacterium]